MGRVRRMGRSENCSTPPARTASACPVRIFSAPEQMAALDEMQAYVHVIDTVFRKSNNTSTMVHVSYNCIYLTQHKNESRSTSQRKQRCKTVYVEQTIADP